jgi:hypothetical protein
MTTLRECVRLTKPDITLLVMVLTADAIWRYGFSLGLAG